MEPLEWIAIGSILLSALGGIWNSKRDDKRYKQEQEFRQEVFDENKPGNRFNEIKDLGATDAFALQGAAGMSSQAYGGTSYNEPYNMAEALRFGDMSDLINAKKSPSEIESNKAGAAVANANAQEAQTRTQYLPRIYEAQIKEMEEEVRNKAKNQEYLDKLIWSTEYETIADVELKTQQAIETGNHVLMLMEEINSIKAQTKVYETQAELNSAETDYTKGVKTDLGNATVENIEADTSKKKTETQNLSLEQENIKMMYEKIKADKDLAVTQELLTQAMTNKEIQLTENMVLDALEKDYELYMRSQGFDPKYSGSMGTAVYNMSRTGLSPDKGGKNVWQIQRFKDWLSDMELFDKAIKKASSNKKK